MNEPVTTRESAVLTHALAGAIIGGMIRVSFFGHTGGSAEDIFVDVTKGLLVGALVGGGGTVVVEEVEEPGRWWSWRKPENRRKNEPRRS